MRRPGSGSCNSPRGLQRELLRHLRGRTAAARASCEVRWEEAGWEPRGLDAVEAWEPRPQVSVRALGAGERGRIPPLPRAWSRSRAPRPGQRPLPPRQQAPPPPRHLRSPPPSPLSVRCREGPPHPQPTQQGGITKHKRTAEDLLDPLGLLQGPEGFKMGTRQPRPRAREQGLLTSFGVCVSSAFENLDENWLIF